MRRRRWAPRRVEGELQLGNGSRVAVIGGGPAGSFFAYFFLRLARLAEVEVAVDIYEPRRFTRAGPSGCNHCGGIVSESLVQVLATEGVRIPETVIQRGIEAYVLHMDVGDVRIEPPGHEKRIAAVYRGNGPRDGRIVDAVSFDRYLLELAEEQGARIERRLVSGLDWFDGRPRLTCSDLHRNDYDLVAVATGVNSNLLAAVEDLHVGYRPPRRVKTFITELELGRKTIGRTLGDAMHVFLLDLPRLEFGALIPKGDFVTVCLLGDGIDDELVSAFLAAPEVRGCFPGGVLPPSSCHCFPRLNVGVQGPAWADRLVFVGDCGVTRLYKDGIGAAYRMAKSAATTALLQGVSADAFARHYGPACRRIDFDNAIGKFLFACGHGAQRLRFSRRSMLRMTRSEQRSPGSAQRLSGILWDLFTGSSPYGDILRRGFHPAFLGGLLWHLAVGGWRDPPPAGTMEGEASGV